MVVYDDHIYFQSYLNQNLNEFTAMKVTPPTFSQTRISISRTHSLRRRMAICRVEQHKYCSCMDADICLLPDFRHVHLSNANQGQRYQLRWREAVQ